jgi:hypothetical protein
MSRTSDPLIPALATGPPGDDLAVMGIDQEGGADHVAIPAGELQPVAAPAQVRTHHHHLAVMGALGPVKAGALQQQVVGLHDAVDALVVNRW